EVRPRPALGTPDFRSRPLPGTTTRRAPVRLVERATGAGAKIRPAQAAIDTWPPPRQRPPSFRIPTGCPRPARRPPPPNRLVRPGRSTAAPPPAREWLREPTAGSQTPRPTGQPRPTWLLAMESKAHPVRQPKPRRPR